MVAHAFTAAESLLLAGCIAAPFVCDGAPMAVPVFTRRPGAASRFGRLAQAALAVEPSSLLYGADLNAAACFRSPIAQ